MGICIRCFQEGLCPGDGGRWGGTVGWGSGWVWSWLGVVLCILQLFWLQVMFAGFVSDGRRVVYATHCVQGKNRSPLGASILLRGLLDGQLERFVLRLAVLADYGFFRAIWSATTRHRAQRRGIERGDDNSDLEDDGDDDEDEPSDSDA